MNGVTSLRVEHIPALIRIIEAQHAASGLHHLGFSHTKVEFTLCRAIAEPDLWCEVVLHDDVPRGLMAGHVTSMLFSHERIGIEELLVVEEGTPRRTAYAKQLVNDFVAWCYDMQVVDIRTGVISNIDNLALDQFYRICGFKRIGTVYSLRDPGGK